MANVPFQLTQFLLLHIFSTMIKLEGVLKYTPGGDLGYYPLVAVFQDDFVANGRVVIMPLFLVLFTTKGVKK